MIPPMHYSLTTLPNGLRVISEHMPGVRSAAVGCWVDTGSRDELENEAGASHFLEHLLFKGSERFPARHISESFDAVGAVSNAFTSKEYTCFWARMVDDDVPMGLELLGEMLQRPAFREAEIDSERHVVLEEINMSEDDPSDLVFDLFSRAVFEGHSLSKPILGTRQSINEMTRDDVQGYWARRYGPTGTVIAVAGALPHDQAVELVMEQFGDWSGGETHHHYEAPALAPRVQTVERPTEQAHMVVGGVGISRDDDRRYAFEVMNHIFGGGMSSRLFQTIREERGLAYAVYSFAFSFAETGAWGVYAGTTPDQADTVLSLVNAEIERLIETGVSEGELDRAKGHVRGSLALSLEDANSRMTRLGRTELIGLEHLSVDERIAKVEAVTPEAIAEAAQMVFAGPRVIGAVGPFGADAMERHVA